MAEWLGERARDSRVPVPGHGSACSVAWGLAGVQQTMERALTETRLLGAWS